MWQTCTEFGWYQSSDSTEQPFGQTFPIQLIIIEFNSFFFLSILLILKKVHDTMVC